MRHKKILVILLSCVVSVVLTYASTSGTDEKRESTRDEERAELRKLREDLESLGRKLDSRRTEQAMEILKTARQQQSDPSDNDPGTGADSEDEAGEGAVAGAVAPVDEHEQRLQMDARFANESVDTAWRSKSIPVLQRQFAAHLSNGARITDIDCKQSLCRVKTVHSDLEDYRKFSHEMVRFGGNEWQGSSMLRIESDPQASGQVQAVAYMAKPGEDLKGMTREEL